MKVLKNAGGFVLLTPEKELKKMLNRIEQAGRVCYQSEEEEITEESSASFIEMLLRRDHESVLEHSLITVKFLGTSRGLTHEMVRHRLASYSQESTRYVDYARRGGGANLDDFQLRCIVPPHRDENEKVLLEDGRYMSLVDMFTEIEKYYRALRKTGWQPQDARQVLPIGIKAEIVVSANFREWRHIFAMRTTKAAHWEIRGVMCELLLKLKEIIPPVFADFTHLEKDNDDIPYFVRN